MDYALREYCKLCSLCTFTNSKGRCVNTSSTHVKGHQNSRGKVFATGHYRSEFTFGKYIDTWSDAVDEDIQRCQVRLGKRRDQADRIVADEYHALRIHKKEMDRFYHAAGAATGFLSHTVCFSCLMGLPQHTLPCGHVSCTTCIKGFGKSLDRSNFSLNSCPLHSDETWEESCTIRFKPDLAGVRVLSLDG